MAATASGLHYEVSDDDVPRASEMLGPPAPPTTGFVDPDERVEDLHGQGADAIASFEADAHGALGGLLGRAPIQPIDLLGDDVDPFDRHGGIGDYRVPEDWQRSQEDGDRWTWRFGNETSGTYPSTNGALLLSPVIDLSTLGAYTDFVPTWRTTGSTGEADLFTLFLTHRFDLATGRDRGLDGGQVRVFMNLTEDGYEAGGTLVRPTTGPTYRDSVSALGGPGFSGSTNWTVSAFDLSNFAGHQIRLGFLVSTVSFEEESTNRFEDTDRFGPLPDKGWQIDELQVRAPAVADNVQVQPFTTPQRPDDDPLPEIAPGQNANVSVPVVNLGADTRNVELVYQVRTQYPRGDGYRGVALHEQTQSVELAPGSVHTFQDDTWAPSTERVAWLGLGAHTSDTENGPSPSRHVVGPAEAWQPVRVHAEPDLSHAFAVDPQTGPPGEPRTVALATDNDGAKASTVEARLTVHHREEPGEDWDNRTSDFVDEDDERIRNVGPQDTATIAWTLAPSDAGTYRLELLYRSGGDVWEQRTASFYVDTGPPARSLFDALRGGDTLPDCPVDHGWNCTRPEGEASPPIVAGSGGDYWASPLGAFFDPQALPPPPIYTELVGTPPPTLAGPCHRLADAETDEGELLADAAGCSSELLQRSYSLLRDGVEPGPEGPTDTLLPGYVDLRLDVRYRAIGLPVDEPPRLRVEMANYDPVRAYLTNTRASPSPLAPDAGVSLLGEAFGDPVHVTIKLPPSNATKDMGLLAKKLEAGWREVSIPLGERMKSATGVKNVWDLSLEEVRFLHPNAGGGGRLLVDELEVTGIPVEDPSQHRTLLRTTGDPADEVGDWTCRLDKSPAPLRTPAGPSVGENSNEGCLQGEVPVVSGSVWKRVNVSEKSSAGSAGWQWNEGAQAWIYEPTSNDDARLVTDSIQLPEDASPRLVLDHEYSTPAEGFRGPGSEFVYELRVGYIVEVQYRRGDGTWSPFYMLNPEGDIPTPEIELASGTRRILDGNLRAGEVFYWPNGSVVSPADIPELAGEGLQITKQIHGGPSRTDVFPLQRSAGAGPPIDLDGREIRLSFRAVHSGGGVGEETEWKIHEAQLWDRPALARNVEVAEVDLLAGGGGTDVALGPGAEVPVELLVENSGRLDVGSVEVVLSVREEGESDEALSRRLERLPANANRTITLRWSVPDDAEEGQRFELRVEAVPTEDVDLSLIDNQAEVGTVTVEVGPKVRVATRVAPPIATTGQIVSLDTVVNNPGNTPLEDVEVERRIWRLGSSTVLEREDRWTVSGSIQPTQRPRSLVGTLETAHEGTSSESPDRWTPTRTASYRVETQVTARSIDDLELTDQHDRVVTVLAPVFRDGFEGDREGGRPGVDWEQTSDAWEKKQEAGFRSSSSWWVGGGEEGYPHETDASLVSPPIDLSSAKSAFLTMAVNYSTEPFFDGAAVEVTTDGGRTWSPVEPQTHDGSLAYPDPLSPASPAGSRGDRGEATGGFSGTTPTDQQLDGWSLHTFPLGQLEELTEAETVLDLIPPTEDEGPLEDLGTEYTRPSWALGTGPTAKRFVVQNLTEPEPTPQTGGTMWYSGSLGRFSEGMDTALQLLVEVPDPETQALQVRFEDWRPGVTPLDRDGVGGCFKVLVNGNKRGLETPPLPLGSAWTTRWLNESITTEETDIRFVYEARDWAESGCTDETSNVDADRGAASIADNRGWAIDKVSVHLIDRKSGQIEEVLARDLTERSPRWSVLEEDDGSPVHWHRAQGPSPTEGDWEAREDEEGATSWHLEPPSGELALPANQQTRLVSPTVDLRGVGNRDIALHLDHDYRFQARGTRGTEDSGAPTLVEGGVVEVQVYNETTQSFDPWRTLFHEPVDMEDERVFVEFQLQDDCAMRWNGPENRCEVLPVAESVVRSKSVADAIGYPFMVHEMGVPFEPIPVNYTYEPGSLVNKTQEVSFLYTDDGGGQERFDLSWLTGKRFRLGFHSWANPAPVTILEESEHWTIHDARVVMDTFTADSVQTRVRFGSDASIAGDHVAVDEISLSQASYERNLALHADGLPENAIEPGSTVWVNGTVQNRGDAARDGFAVRLAAADLEVPLVLAPGHASSSGTAGEPLPAVSAPLSLGSAGSTEDTLSFAFPIRVPDDVDPVHGNLTLRLVELDKDESTDRVASLTDEVAGNKRAEIPVTLGETVDARLELELEPNRVAVGQTADVHARVANTGTRPIAPEVEVTVLGPDGFSLIQESEQLQLPAGETVLVERGLFVPQAGFYTVEASLTHPAVQRHASATLPANATTDPLSTDWSTLSDWQAWAPPKTVREQCMNPTPKDQDEPPSPGSPAWRRTDGAGLGGMWGLLFGARQGSPEAPPGYQDAGIVSPPIDLNEIEDPRLTFLHRPHFYTEGAGAVVEVQVLDRSSEDPLHTTGSGDDNCRGPHSTGPNQAGWFLVRPEVGYNEKSISNAGSTSLSGSGGPSSTNPSHLSPLGSGHPLIGGAQRTWSQFRAELTEQSLSRPDGDPIDLSEELVRFRLRATTIEDDTAPGEGWNVGALVVGSGGLDVKPDHAERTFVDGAEKRLELDVGNPGDRREVYRVALVEEDTTLPTEWFDLSQGRVEVPAGQTRPLNASLSIPVSETNQRATYRLSLVFTSAFDPALVDLVTYTIHVVPSEHPNLVTRFSASGDEIEIGGNTLLSATVANTGLVANTPTRASFWVEAPDGTRRTIAEEPVPPIEPSRGGNTQSVSLTVPWTAPEDALGPYRFGVEVDPRDRIVEFNETDNEASDGLEVIPRQRPDLAVRAEDVRLLQVSGAPLEAADPGALVQVMVTVHNEGNKPAQRAKVSLALGPEPVAQRTIDRLPPGQARTFSFTVFAPGNETVVSADASTLQSELDEDNNRARVVLPVRRSDVSIAPAEGELSLVPANATDARLAVSNGGRQAVLVRLDTVDEAFTLDTPQPSVLVDPDETRHVRARLGVAPSAPPGSTTVPVRVTDAASGRSATVELPVVVEEQAALRLHSPEKKTVGLSSFALPVAVENTGNVPLTPALQLEPPEGWGTPSTSARVLEPGEARSTTVQLSPPAGTPAGNYAIPVSAQAPEGPGASETVVVHLEATASVQVSPSLASAGTHPIVYDLTVENTGNVPSTVALDLLEEPVGWQMDVEDPVVELAPRQETSTTLLLSRTSESAPLVGSFLAQARLSPDAPVEQASLERAFAGSLNAMSPDVAVSSVEPTPALGVTGGEEVRYEVTVENRGAGPAAPVPVYLYHQDELVEATELAHLSPGDEARVNFTVTADEGLQTVVAAADPHEQLVDADPSNNALARDLAAEGSLLSRGVPGPGASWVALCLAALAGFGIRRREV